MGSTMDISEPGELYRELLAQKQALEVELRQRSASTSSYLIGSKLAISLTSTRGAVRLALASGPGLMVIKKIKIISNDDDGLITRLLSIH